MLPFEPGEMQRYKLGLGRLRLIFLKNTYIRALRYSTAVIFLTRYASKMIQQITGPLSISKVIPHGVNDGFRNIQLTRKWSEEPIGEIRCIYVSSAAPYKHQWHVVRAIKLLRTQGISISLALVGGGDGGPQRRLDEEIRLSDTDNDFVTQHPFIHIDDIPNLLSDSDLFIFASSCENMPVTLIEGMASGLPIACSNRGPMPEVLGNGGVFFDPEDPESIADAIKLLIKDPKLRKECVEISYEIASEYLWSTNARKTFEFLVETIKNSQKP